jgi:hypothetical protein
MNQEFLNKTVNLSIDKQLRSGIYLIEVMQNGERVVKRIMVSE